MSGRPFKPGQSGNPAGRPKGSKNKLAESFIKALADDFSEHGASAIEIARVEDPAGYLRVIASVLPKELVLTDERGTADLPDDELVAIAAGGRARAAGAADGEEIAGPVH